MYQENMVLSYEVNFTDEMRKLYNETIGKAQALLEKNLLALYSYNDIVAFNNTTFKELNSVYEEVLYSEMNNSGEDGPTLYMDEQQFNSHIEMFNNLQSYLETRMVVIQGKFNDFQEEFEREDEELEYVPMKYYEKMMMDGLEEEMKTIINLLSNCEIMRTTIFVEQS